MKELNTLLTALLRQRGVPEGFIKPKVQEYLYVVKDLNLEEVLQVLKEWGLVEPDKLRELVLKRQALKAFRELNFVLERLPSGSGVVRFTDKRLAGFVNTFGIDKIRNMSEEELRYLFFKFYPVSPTDTDIVYDISPSTSVYVFLDLPARKSYKTKDLKKLQGLTQSLPQLAGGSHVRH